MNRQVSMRCTCAAGRVQRRHAVQAIGLCGAALAASTALGQTAPTPGQLTRNIVFQQPAPPASNDVLMRRLLTPRQRERQLASLAARGAALASAPLDTGAERFAVYLPKQSPPSGYGLLVFVPPWQDARLPRGWSEVLDRAGIIFVTAERSGNDESIMGRRIPLALTAAYALAERYHVDRDRTLIGGFSGGAHVALRTALGYPDLFAGVLLNSGSDPIGTAYDPLPFPALMSLLQTRTRFVFVTGENDETNLSRDAQARLSLASWCIDASRTVMRPHVGHEIMDGNGLGEALAALKRPHPRDPGAIDRCRLAVDAKLTRARADAAALHDQPRTSHVDEQLDRLDEQFGALLDDGAKPLPNASE